MLAHEIEELWSCAGEAIVCLSVRSAFDLLLTSLKLPRGSEVLVSAVTIGGMLRIIEEHGLVAVPADLDAISMAPHLDTLARGLSARTRAVLVAHLFGGRIDLRPIADFTRRHHLILIEDAAQAYAGPGYIGHHAADVSLFSFGPIKTATALGGAIVRVRDRTLLARMRTMQAGWPVQRRSDFLARVGKYAALKTMSQRVTYRVMASSLARSGERQYLEEAALVQALRQPLLSLLLRRLRHFDSQRLADRIRFAEQIMGRRRATPLFPGSACEPHVHWLLPVWSNDPRCIIKTLTDAAFDCTQGQSLTVVAPPDGRPELEPVTAREILAGIVFLPCYPEMAPTAVESLAGIISCQPSPSGSRDDSPVTRPRLRHQPANAIV